MRTITTTPTPSPSRDGTRASAKTGCVGRLRGLRVLLVEDDEDARELIGAILVQAGAQVHSEGSAADVLQALEVFRPQLLVSDIAMPCEDGYSLIRRIRALDSVEGQVPSIALTAFTRAEDRTRALSAGFTEHVGKPVDPVQLVATLAHLAGRGQA